MSENLKLQYFTPGLGPGEAIHFKECEEELLACLQDSWGECQVTLWNLVRLAVPVSRNERSGLLSGCWSCRRTLINELTVCSRWPC